VKAFISTSFGLALLLGSSQTIDAQTGGAGKDQPPGLKEIQEAIEKMRSAREKILDPSKKEDPTPDQRDAIRKLEEARNKLEERLRILRELELERLKANLKTRLERMLVLQKDVLLHSSEGTIATWDSIQRNPDKKPADSDIQASLKLGDKEKEIVNECQKTIELLEGEGSAVALPVALQQVHADMKSVQLRLDPPPPLQIDVGPFTQSIERDIIASLEEMIAVVTKKQEDMKKRRDEPPGRKPGESKPPEDQKLLDQIAELKMIRSMQIRLNKRTEDYAQQFPGVEQADICDGNARREVGELRGSQERIYDITNKIQKGDNK
jgi:hypothetical protein